MTNAGSILDTQGNTVTLSGVIGGGGALTKLGTGTLILSAHNTYTGGTTASAGTLQIGNATALGTDGVSVLSGAILDVHSFATTVSSLSGAGSITLGSGTLTAGNGNATSTYSGILSGTGILTKIGTGTLTFSGSNTYSGGTKINGGTLAISSDGNLGAVPSPAATNLTFDGGSGGTLLASANATLNANRSVLLSAAGTVNTNGYIVQIAGTVSGTGALSKVGTGTLTLDALSATGPLSVGAGTLALPSRHVPQTNALAIAGTPTTPTATVDIRDGGLVVKAPAGGGSAAQQQARDVADWVVSGINGPTLFTGQGITSSTAAANAGSQLFAVGWMQNNLAAAGTSDGTTSTGSTSVYTTFGIDSVSVAFNDTLVRYTYFGDADLNGVVDGTDYFLLDQGHGGGLAGWVNGDFDGSGVVDGTDYFLIDNAYGSQASNPLAVSFQPLSPASAVPEPSALAWLWVSGASFIRRSGGRRSIRRG